MKIEPRKVETSGLEHDLRVMQVQGLAGLILQNELTQVHVVARGPGGTEAVPLVVRLGADIACRKGVYLIVGSFMAI